MSAKGKAPQKVTLMEPPVDEGATENGEQDVEINFEDTAAALAAIFEELSEVKAIVELGFARQIKAATTGGKVRALGFPIGPASWFKAIHLSSPLVVAPSPDDAAFVQNRVSSTPVPPPKVAAGVTKNATEGAHASAAWKAMTKEERAAFKVRYEAAVASLPDAPEAPEAEE